MQNYDNGKDGSMNRDAQWDDKEAVAKAKCTLEKYCCRKKDEMYNECHAKDYPVIK